MQALRNSIQDQQQTESGSKFINEDKPQKDAYQAAVQNAKDLINQTGNPTLDKAQVEQLTQAVTPKITYMVIKTCSLPTSSNNCKCIAKHKSCTTTSIN